MEIKEVLKKNEKDFDGWFMNNGVNGLLDDKFQDAKMLLIKKAIKKSNIELLEAVVEMVEKELSKCEKEQKEQSEDELVKTFLGGQMCSCTYISRKLLNTIKGLI